MCSSFVYANSNNTKRTKRNFEGNILYPPVAEGKILLALFAAAVDCKVVTQLQRLSELTFAGSCLPLYCFAGNLIAEISMFIVMVAAFRGVHFYMENPAGSMLFSFLAEYLAFFNPSYSTICDRCAFSTEKMGSATLLYLTYCVLLWNNTSCFKFRVHYELRLRLGLKY